MREGIRLKQALKKGLWKAILYRDVWQPDKRHVGEAGPWSSTVSFLLSALPKPDPSIEARVRQGFGTPYSWRLRC